MERCSSGSRLLLEELRRVAPGFDAAALPHTGQYPMLECPEEFNRVLDGIGVTLFEPAA
jgi:hypothetical protein